MKSWKMGAERSLFTTKYCKSGHKSSYGNVDNLSTKRVPSPKNILSAFVHPAPTSFFPFFKKYKDLKTVQFLLFVYKIFHLNIHLTATGERGSTCKEGWTDDPGSLN